MIFTVLPIFITLLQLQANFPTISGAVSRKRANTIFSPCEQSSCYPATGDLLVGRESRLSASSTCGLERPSRYCIVSHLEDQVNKCFVCDSTVPFGPDSRSSHRIQNIVSTFKRDWRLRWWQAENGLQNVSVRLDLEAEFHFTHLIMRFKTFRPAAMLIERSYDFGKTWKVYRYFAHDCADSFPSAKTTPIRSINDVICESRYSDVAPSTEGEVIFRVLPVNVRIEDPYSEQVQDLLKITNLRVNFTGLHTLGDDLLDSRELIKEKYYYALYNMVVRGSCSCYGHASRCVPLPGQEDNANMVHGRCECTHYTKGLNCEQCEDFYNDLPWRPARGLDTNACKRCDCNNHATRCHFDPAVYEATGRVSGGVCDECRDNTMGYHCEECRPFFYHEPGRDITDPYVCRQCDCDPIGSEHGGECDSRTDPVHGFVAGRCICKRYVEGSRCDVCVDDFWNMKLENPGGCEACNCYPLGTIGDFGCDKISGDCRCKRYVTGRQCDQCHPGYWNLSNDVQGCEACNCDIGGAYSHSCDQSTGHCKCRPNVIGRLCDQIRPGYFITTLDWQRYEAETASGFGNHEVMIREPIPGRPITWTGTGFMRVFESSSLEFVVDDIPLSMDYSIIVRYEPQTHLRWDDVQLRVIRPGPVDQQGACANNIPQDDVKAFSLPQGSRQLVVPQSICLERGVAYTIRLDFVRYQRDHVSTEGNILIDSIVLMPGDTGHPLMQPGDPRNFRDDFERYRCRDHHTSASHSPLSDICKHLTFSSSVAIYDGAAECDCDPVGSENLVCDPFGGQCLCKSNVTGRRCDRCFQGTYGFGSMGCTACECSDIGARDDICDAQTGQCNCVPNASGRQCTRCERGFYGFPYCRPCQCSGRAEECDSDSGQCLSCRDYTGGHYCDRCADGYYGDPQAGCRPCLCPGGHGSGFQHGGTCQLDTRRGNVVCDCRQGYAGLSCDRCADGYFGNPLVPGGTCEPCQCNNNIDPRLPGSCDASTGECLQCLYNSEGFNCERCKLGFYGDASQQDCRACTCNILGTHRTEYRSCDRVTGQCSCLPHVIGLHCSECQENYWKLASGAGCEACSCDPTGSKSAQCNEYDGQCDCNPGRGGRDCSECEDLFWGDPRDGECKPCNCNSQGSTALQCNRRTGQCECALGVTGTRCDRCDRGTTGTLPHCVPCGECYDNWDKIINELGNETRALIELGSDIKLGGAPGAFEKEFSEMEEKLAEVRHIVTGANVSENGLQEIMEKLKMIRTNLTDSSGEISEIDEEVRGSTDKVETINLQIEAIKSRVETLKKVAQELRENATKVQEMDVSGAFNSIRESHNRSQIAEARVNATDSVIGHSASTREEVNRLLEDPSYKFEDQLEGNKNMLDDLDNRISETSRSIVDINEIVCDGRGDPCDDSCGGAGCGKCGGGISCQDGSVNKAISAQDFSRRAEVILMEKQKEADLRLNEANDIKAQCEAATELVDMAFWKAEEAKNESISGHNAIKVLIEEISAFLEDRGARAQEIEMVAEEVLKMTISLSPDEIMNLARQINGTIESLTNIDAILDATRNDLHTVTELKKKADDTKMSADDVHSTAQRIIELLTKAGSAQDDAGAKLQEARVNFNVTEKELLAIEQQMSEYNLQSENTNVRVHNLTERIKALKQKFAENEVRVQRAEEEAKEAERLAHKAESDAKDLEMKYTEVSQKLEVKVNETKIARERADNLKERASVMYQNIYSKFQTLQEMQTFFDSQEKTLIQISSDVDSLTVQMSQYLQDIIDVSKLHRTCSL